MHKKTEHLTAQGRQAFLEKGAGYLQEDQITPLHAIDQTLVDELHTIICVQQEALERLKPLAPAIIHLCRIVRTNDKVRYHIGPCSEMWERLCEALAGFFNKPKKNVEAYLLGASDRI